jgi:uncharacterized protein
MVQPATGTIFPMKHLSLMIKPASSLCNMRCRYCFYADISGLRQVASHGIMETRTAHAIIENVFKDLEDGDEVSFAFQGGEPTLAGLPWYEDFTETVSAQPKRVKTQYALQTNGLLINGAWGEFFNKHNFLVGLSIDGGARFHNDNRVDAQNRGTYRAVMEEAALPAAINCFWTNP